MSILTAVDTDHSATLARQFAVMASEYLSAPGSITREVLQVPLENLFRLSEMFRYGAFADEPRKGVLAIDTAAPEKLTLFQSEQNWSNQIEQALRAALSDHYGHDSETAIDELQGALRAVASKVGVTEQQRNQLRGFLTDFQSKLG